ncbi:hypothetical protein M409DRAFT_49294 [Zasmidium cellare ATCC 36951]|uniref:Proteophosphoglycan 5 n=1 Tax=Zasmidium cellare ATCC 36951 TaxID=1080233 RepID=A0A6A6D057_ZASCE|nr:uncharacterized protein M409DRAFT_49294 [Zasmidium cellare ATCC 36951]KAF2172761.1 hypothetical protein M409DRAFT_49294 [Zasmidium cellare ATCC 36951]
MADYISDTPNQSAPAGGSNQRTPSSAHNKRNNRNRKHNPQTDGTVSDGALAHPASPRAKKPQNQAHQQRQSVAGAKAVPIPQNGNMGNANGQKPRPVSVGGNLIPMTPAKEQAYAASAFQASPAPSSLPMPKFFSKSVPNAADPSSLQAPTGDRMQDGQTSSPESDNISPAPPPREAQQSPLDFFFKADRAEKERMRNGSAPTSLGSEARFAPPPRGYASGSQHFGKNMFMQELDGDDTDMPSPRTIPPNNRPPTNRQYSSPALSARPGSSDQERQAHTKALKDQLFSIAATPPREHSRPSSGSQTPDGVFGSPSPLQRPVSGPLTPQSSSDPQQSQFLHYNSRMNLSPVFQKFRSDTPPRQSALRQELPNDVVSSADSAVDSQANYPRPPSNDSQAFARSYLKEQIRTSGPAELPQFPWKNGPAPVQHPRSNEGSGPVPIRSQPVHAQHGVPSSTTPRSNGSKDIKGMEDDLRKMLKINDVLG